MGLPARSAMPEFIRAEALSYREDIKTGIFQVKSKILVVDDEKLMRLSIDDKLVKEGYAVTSLSNAGEGIKPLQSTNFDAVITDLRLPRIDGIDFLREIKKSSPDTVVIIMTAYGSIENAVVAMKEGAYDYVTKPFSLEELIIRLKKALKHKNVVEENILLKQRVLSQYGYDNIIGKGEGMKRVFDVIGTVSNRNTTILIQGESGTGKEITAGAIHYNSNRRDGPFIKVSCAALNKEILESELFGLENVIEHAVTFCASDTIIPNNLPVNLLERENVFRHIPHRTLCD